MDDPRFQRIKRDPSFKSLPKKLQKAKLNQRFKKVLTDSKFSTKPKFDKYGNRNVANNKREYEDHYDISEEEPVEQPEEQEQAEEQEQSQPQSQSEQGSYIPSQLSESYSVDEIEYEEGDDEWEIDQKEVQQAPEILKATCRLALQNYEWQEIKAKDLMVLFQSFVAQGGQVKSVSVYLSAFGKQRLAEEEEFGPVAIFKEDFKVKKRQRTTRAVINDFIVSGDRNDLDVDPQKLRTYEKDRLKYYYAVIECDSAATSDSIYQQCNGNEFELSNLKIDLRFIPDDMELPKENLSHFCNELPSKVTKKTNTSRAVGHTNVKLTWEESKPRASVWSKNIKNLESVDWDEVVGNYESEDEAKIQQDVRDMVNAVNQDESEEDWKDAFNKKGKSNLKVTFSSGFNADGNNAIIDRMAERPNKKHYGPKQGNTDDFFIGFDEKQDEQEEKLNYKERRKERQHNIKESRKQREALSLLVDERKKPDVAFNPKDSRFKAIYDKSEFAIDPTHKQFHKDAVFDEQVKRKSKNVKL